MPEAGLSTLNGMVRMCAFSLGRCAAIVTKYCIYLMHDPLKEGGKAGGNSACTISVKN